jgi:hypothetical protein
LAVCVPWRQVSWEQHRDNKPDGHLREIMPDSDVLKSFSAGNPPKSIRMIAARGLVPIPPGEMLLLLVRLAQDSDQEVAQRAKETLNGWNEKEIVTRLEASECSQEVLEHFAGSTLPAIQEAIILNPHAPAALIANLASCVATPLLETILYNRTRLLDSPEILQEIKLNPAATPEILRLVEEMETEFFGSKKRAYTVTESDQSAPARRENIELEVELPPGDLALEGLPIDPQEREAAILSRIGAMTVRQKIQLARMGTREARSVLIRDTNKEVSRSVLQSPKLTVTEVEAFAAMRNASEDVLRLIGSSKNWTRSYAVTHNLVKNPKTPPMVSQRLLSRLHPKDLMMLSRDRGIPEALKRSAERMLKQRNAPKS